MNFDTERWKLLKICEMNARRSCIPGIQKMAGEIFVDPWPQSDSDIWLSMFTEAKAVNMNLCSYLFLIRGCGTYLQGNSSYGLTGSGWPYLFKPCVSSDTWPSKNVFQEIMNDMFRQFSAQQIYRVMKNTWDFQKSVSD